MVLFPADAYVMVALFPCLEMVAPLAVQLYAGVPQFEVALTVHVPGMVVQNIGGHVSVAFIVVACTLTVADALAEDEVDSWI
jgi:hypothetical protein